MWEVIAKKTGEIVAIELANRVIGKVVDSAKEYIKWKGRTTAYETISMAVYDYLKRKGKVIIDGEGEIFVACRRDYWDEVREKFGDQFDGNCRVTVLFQGE